MKGLGAFWLALAGLGLSVFDVSENLFADIPYWHIVQPYSTRVIQAILVIGIVILILEQAKKAKVYYQVTHTKEHGIGWADVKREDLKKIHEIGVESIGDVCSVRQLEDLFNHNKKCFRKIVDNANRNEIIGYIIIMPLTAEGIRQIQSNSFHLFDGEMNNFWRTNLPSGKPYYLSALVGKTDAAKYVATKTVHVFCENKEVTSLYARAATKDGLDLLADNEFHPVQGGSPAKGVLFVRHKLANHPSSTPK